MAETIEAPPGHPVLDWLIADYRASSARRRNKGEDEVRRYLEIAALEPTEELAHQRTTALEEEAAARYFAARRGVKPPTWNLVARLRAARTVRRLANDLSAAHNADRMYWLVHRNHRMAARGRELALQKAAIETHTAVWDGDTRTLSCSCGETAGYLTHIAA
ncbi:hypothetical protein GCM10023063_17540 [Arthrobacter methylotrophus]|uniref:HNH endonuclease n=1 Tax=Arthrobacter methylotrophus TaxID=121291 RepID=A0ABV5UNR6_9MICC